MFEQIKEQAENAVRELLEVSKLQPGELLVIGCSSSEIMGERIGKGSSMEAAQAVYEGIAPVLEEKGILLAAQCCEHLNRALIVERSTAEKFGYEPVMFAPGPMRAAPSPRRSGSIWSTRRRWSTSGRMRAWTSATR